MLRDGTLRERMLQERIMLREAAGGDATGCGMRTIRKPC